MKKHTLTYLFAWIGLWIFACSPLIAQRKATILDHQDRIRLTKLDVLNSSYRETNLSITPDGNYLYFMSMRGGKFWSNKYMEFRGDSVYDGDIWYSQKVNGAWQQPVSMPFGINTGTGEDEPQVSGDGKTVYFQSWYDWLSTGGPYYSVKRNGAQWTNPRGLGGGITEFFKRFNATDGMALSPDESTFVVACGHGYEANMDLYISRKGPSGWGYCRQLPINTPYDERSVFIAADNRTLYFASNGYQGFGGLDIYKTTLHDDGTIGEVINIGAPFNTPADDYGFILTGNGMEAYFVRSGDIYFADLKDADDRIKPETIAFKHLLKGTVRDSLSWKGIQADILVLDARSKRLIRKVTTDASGNYRIELPNIDKEYDVMAASEGYPKSRRTVQTEATAYQRDAYTANFLLASPSNSTPPVSNPPLASNPPKPQVQTPPKPQAQPQPKPEPEKEQPTLTQIQPQRNPAPLEPQITPQPDNIDPIQVEDMYSFDGVAENNLILLLDVSASMKKPEKLTLFKESFGKMLDHMRPEDQISIITYSGEVKVVLDGVSAIERQKIITTIENLRGAGSTQGKTALRRAYRTALDHYVTGGNNRIVMATDGYFNIPDLYSIAEKNAEKGISLSVLSFGKLNDLKHEELSVLAQRGRGNYASVTPGNVDEMLLREAKAVQK